MVIDLQTIILSAVFQSFLCTKPPPMPYSKAFKFHWFDKDKPRKKMSKKIRQYNRQKRDIYRLNGRSHWAMLECFLSCYSNFSILTQAVKDSQKKLLNWTSASNLYSVFIHTTASRKRLTFFISFLLLRCRSCVRFQLLQRHSRRKCAHGHNSQRNHPVSVRQWWR